MITFKRLRHELNPVYCYIKNQCELGKAGSVRQMDASKARRYMKDVMIIPPIRKLLQHQQIYTILGFPMNKILPFMESERRAKIKRLGKVVPEWKKALTRIEVEERAKSDKLASK